MIEYEQLLKVIESEGYKIKRHPSGAQILLQHYCSIIIPIEYPTSRLKAKLGKLDVKYALPLLLIIYSALIFLNYQNSFFIVAIGGIAIFYEAFRFFRIRKELVHISTIVEKHINLTS